MTPTFDLATSTLRLAFTDRSEAKAFFAETVREGVFMTELDERPADFATLQIHACDAGSFEFACEACAVQIFPQGRGFGVVVQLAGWNEAAEARLLQRLAHVETAPSEDSETLGVAPVFRIKQLDLAQKMQLALKADTTERQILCREPAPMVLLNLLANPRLEAENVLAIVKSNFSTADIFQRVAADRRWMASAEIRTAVVRNPKTPTPIAVKLLDTLPLGELRDLAKMGNAKEDLRKAAFRVYTKLSGHR